MAKVTRTRSWDGRISPLGQGPHRTASRNGNEKWTSSKPFVRCPLHDLKATDAAQEPKSNGHWQINPEPSVSKHLGSLDRGWESEYYSEHTVIRPSVHPLANH